MVTIKPVSYARAEIRLNDELLVSPYVQYTVDDKGLVNHTADAFLVAIFGTAMLSGNDIEVHEIVSRQLVENLYKLQDIYAQIYPDFNTKHINIEAIEQAPIPSQGHVGLTFGAGIDSWHSLINHLGEVDSLIYSADNMVRKPGEATRVAKEAAARFNLNLVGIGHNWADPVYQQPRNNLGIPHKWAGIPLLLSTAHHLSPRYKKIIYTISGPFNSEELALFGHEELELRHFGWPEPSRFDKCAALSKSPHWDFIAPRIRPCGYGPNPVETPYLNCSRCEKCVRTAMMFHVLGVLDQVTGFVTTERQMLEDMAGLGPAQCSFLLRRDRRDQECRDEWLDIATKLGTHTHLGRAAYAIAQQ